MFWIIRAIHSYNKALILSIVVILGFDYCVCVTTVGNVKYGNMQLSSKSGHSNDFVRSESMKNIGSTDDLNNSVVSGLDGSNVHGGEVLASKSLPLSSQEPTCEQLRAMWIFSKRQSRAAEMTNEIPTYRDPFAYNIWEPFYTSSRSSGGMHISRYGERLPVFGRIVSREPILSQRFAINHYQKHLSEPGASRIFGSETKPNNVVLRRPTTQSRYGSNASTQNSASHTNNQNSIAVQGSFQKLKELIWTERAKELTQQRRAEEIAARAAALKEIANGRIHQNYKQYSEEESPLMDENRSPDSFQIRRKEQQISMPNDQLQKSEPKLKINKSGRTSSFRNPKNNRVHDIGTFHFVDPRLAVTNLQFKKDNDLRSSIFRERNRMNLQQDLPDTKFYRSIRKNIMRSFPGNTIESFYARLPLNSEQNSEDAQTSDENVKKSNNLNFNKKASKKRIFDYPTENNIFN